MAEMLIQSENLTAIADEIRILSGTEDGMSLDAMAIHVSEANEDVNSEADLIAQINSALEGKAGGGSGSSGIEYEIITIPAGATSASYSLPSVTNAYGSVANYLELTTEDNSYNAITSFLDNIVYFVISLYWNDGSFDFASATIDSVTVYFNNGTITWDDGPSVIEPVQLLLINDPSKNAISDL